MSIAEKMYQENILDHYKRPRNKRELEGANIKHVGLNPICGDEVKIMATVGVGTGMIRDVAFQGHGCAISQASASMLTEFVKGKNVAELKKMSKEDVTKMLSIPVSPTRLKCAILPLKALQYGINEFETGKKMDDVSTEKE